MDCDIINFNKLSTASQGILNAYNAYDTSTLIKRFYLMAENDMEVLFEDKVINALHKSIWNVINKLTDAGMYDQSIMDYVISNQFIKITRVDMDEELIVNIMHGNRVYVKVTVDGEVYVDKEFASIAEYISSYGTAELVDHMGEHYGNNE